MQFDLNLGVRLVHLETLTEDLGIRAFAHDRNMIEWSLGFKHPTQNSYSATSHILFEDRHNVTQRFLTELHFATKLKDVAKPNFEKIKVIFGYNSSQENRKNVYHTIKVFGEGIHSFLEWKETPFELEINSNQMMNSMINSLLFQATRAPI